MIVVLFLLGLFVGAFLNLCADQLPRWRRLRRAPFCPRCEEPRPWWAWLSLSAFLLRRHRCPRCGTPISRRHPLVELGTAVAFALVWWYDGPTALLIPHIIYVAIFILVVVIDLEHRLILNVVMFPAWLIALLLSFIHPRPNFYRLAILGGVVGFGLLFLIYLAGELFIKVLSRMRGKPINAVAFGFGDVRLGGFIGLVLGFPDVFTAILLAILLGGVAGLLYWFVRAVILRNYSPFSAIPYGPFLVLGAVAIMFFGV